MDSRKAGRTWPEMRWIVRRSPDGNNALHIPEDTRYAARADQPRSATCGGMSAWVGLAATGSSGHALDISLHTAIGTAANVNDVTQATQLLHGQEKDAFGDAGYQCMDKRPEARGLKVRWHIALRPGKRAALERRRAAARAKFAC